MKLLSLQYHFYGPVMVCN